MMSRPKRDYGLMAVLAADSRNRTEQETIFIVGQIAKKLIKAFVRDYSLLLSQHKSVKIIAEYNELAVKAGVDMATWTKAVIEAFTKLLGDPLTMWQDHKRLHHAIPYVNPEPVALNLHPLGLPKSDENGRPTKEIVDFVQPGEVIYIPQPYTIGGKYSTLTGVAPQLRPCPRVEDEELDLQPTTYEEWCHCTSGDQLSECCNKGVVWSDELRRLMCGKCGERVYGC